MQADLQNFDTLADAMQGFEFVFHLAANADVRFGTEHPRKDFEQNAIVTSNGLEVMRSRKVRRIAFSSTGLVYGEAKVFPNGCRRNGLLRPQFGNAGPGKVGEAFYESALKHRFHFDFEGTRVLTHS